MARLWTFALTCGLGFLLTGATLAQAPTPPRGEAPAPAVPATLTESEPIFGVEVDPEIVRLPADVRAESAKMKGLRVRSVVPGTMANQAGLQPGDVIYMINNHRIHNFDDVMEILVELRPNVTGRVDYVRGNATFIRDFRPDQTYNKDFNLLYAICAKESRFAGRFDFCGIVCNTKETKTHTCGSFAFLGPLIFDFHKVGPAKSVTTLFFLTFRKGKPAPVVF